MKELYIPDSRGKIDSALLESLSISVDPSAIVKNSTLCPYSRIDRYSRFQDSRMGRHSYIGQSSVAMSAEISSFVSISWNVTIGARNHPIELPSQHSFLYNDYDKIFSNGLLTDRKASSLKIGSDVWIGSGACVLSDLDLQPGSVIGANSVVTSSTEPYGIYIGAPARLKRFRFSDEIISKLLTLSWWKFDDNILGRNHLFFSSPPTIDSIDSFLTNPPCID